MKASDCIGEFLQTLDSVTFKIDILPSGLVWFEVRRGEDFFVIECTHDGEIGISRLENNSNGFTGHDEVFAEVAEAIEYLRLRLVKAKQIT